MLVSVVLWIQHPGTGALTSRPDTRRNGYCSSSTWCRVRPVSLGCQKPRLCPDLGGSGCNDVAVATNDGRGVMDKAERTKATVARLKRDWPRSADIYSPPGYPRHAPSPVLTRADLSIFARPAPGRTHQSTRERISCKSAWHYGAYISMPYLARPPLFCTS